MWFSVHTRHKIKNRVFSYILYIIYIILYISVYLVHLQPYNQPHSSSMPCPAPFQYLVMPMPNLMFHFQFHATKYRKGKLFYTISQNRSGACDTINPHVHINHAYPETLPIPYLSTVPQPLVYVHPHTNPHPFSHPKTFKNWVSKGTPVLRPSNLTHFKTLLLNQAGARNWAQAWGQAWRWA